MRCVSFFKMLHTFVTMQVLAGGFPTLVTAGAGKKHLTVC